MKHFLSLFITFTVIFKSSYAATFRILNENDSAQKVATSRDIQTTRDLTNIFRRQNEEYGLEGPKGDPRLAPPRFATRISNRAKKFESQYLPFYPGGEWVYYRNASTNFPRPKILLNDTDPAYRDCNHICLKAYLNYGQICAKRLNVHNWVYEYREFDDICQMELENCRAVGKRYDWYPLRRGPCATTDFPFLPTDGAEILKRLEEYEKTFLQIPGNDAYNPFTATTTTMLTLKSKRTTKKK